jgi:DNA-binding response OmpR family regulator
VPRILVIDDDAAIRQVVKTVLERKGFEVIQARDGDAGIRIYKENPVDLVITDIFLPGKSGLDTIMEIRGDFPDAKIIAMSGGGPTMSAEGCLLLSQGLGVQRTLYKPLSMRELLEAVEFVLGQERSSTFSGRIDGVEILDYFQFLLLSGKRAVVKVVSAEGRSCLVFIKKGRIVHAVSEDTQGEEAFYQCATFKGGSFFNLEWREPDLVTIHKSAAHMIIEAARRRDDA